MPKGKGYGRKKMGGRNKKSLGARRGNKKYYVGGYVA